ncbi:hypothetical protein JOF53_007804 [Crossiella equi]|uniref:Terpene synthase n=1 Tax=Crossiella equi TaxID=130796 RepID=A0ABS5AR94_9PSEU|nr:hypothetical protein [Crossiella equi]MBP2478932.1 hypothetical protein [Crossiella equi]
MSKYSAEVDDASFEWLLRFGLVHDPRTLDRLRRQRSGDLAARTNPEAGRDQLQILSDWYMWLFAFDDSFSEDGSDSACPAAMALAMGQLSRSLDCGYRPTGPVRPYADALCDIRDRIAAYGSPSLLDRWTHTVHNYFLAQVWEAGNRERGSFAGLDEYVVMRRHAGATYTCLAIIEMASGLEMPAEIALSPAMRRVNDITANLVSWDNDLFSHAKEKVADHGRHNLIEVIAQQERRTPSAVHSRCLDLRNEEMREFLLLTESLSRGGDPATQDYLRKLGLWLRGHIEWSAASSRFEVETAGSPA